MGIRLAFKAGRQVAFYRLESSHLSSYRFIPADSFSLVRRTRFGGHPFLMRKAKAVTAEMVQEGVLVIDMKVTRNGMNREGQAILCSDVEFDARKGKAAMITPVAGGAHDHHDAHDEHGESRQGLGGNRAIKIEIRPPDPGRVRRSEMGSRHSD